MSDLFIIIRAFWPVWAPLAAAFIVWVVRKELIIRDEGPEENQ